MKRGMRRSLSQVLIGGAIVTFAAPAGAQDCHVPVLRRGPDGFSLQLEDVPSGESKVIMPTGEERVVTTIVPVSAGMSGDVIRGSEDGILLVRCDSDRIRVMKGPAGGGPAREMATATRDSFHRYALRVNVVASDGEKAAFWIREGALGPDDGPVVDMFRGMVPLEEGDVAVTTEVAEASPPPTATLTGTVPLGVLGPYPSVPVTLPGGTTRDFILDLAASRSVVSRDILPEDTQMRRMMAVERSAQGTREVEAHAQGAGGAATSITSTARLDWVELGDVRLDDFEPLVLDTPFLVDGEPVVGVIGLDVLRRAGRATADFGRPERPSRLHLGGAALPADVEIPLRRVRGLYFVDGQLGGLPVLLLLDSGARLSVLPRSLADREGWPVSAIDADTLRGVDGRPLPVHPVSVPPLRIGPWEPPQAGFVAGPIPVVENLGLQSDSGILGQPFWQAVGRVQIDFEAERLRVLSHRQVPGGT